MPFHADQSDAALQASWKAQDGRCAWCNEEHGWWQGFVADTKLGGRWVCAGCGTITGHVPAPEGLVTFKVHPEVVHKWDTEINNGFPSLEFTRKYGQAFPLMLAWMLEQGWLDLMALGRRQVAFTNASKPEAWTTILCRKPIWFAQQKAAPLDFGQYADSPEDRELTAVFRQVLRQPEFTRTRWTQDAGEWAHDLNLRAWVGDTPEGHPARTNGWNYATVVPWSAFFDHPQVLLDSWVVEAQVHDPAVHAGVRALIRAKSFTNQSPLWESAGLS